MNEESCPCQAEPPACVQPQGFVPSLKPLASESSQATWDKKYVVKHMNCPRQHINCLGMMKLSHLEQGLADFRKDQAVNALGFAGHMAAVTSTQLGYCETDTQIQRTEHGCVSIKRMMDAETELHMIFMCHKILFLL